MHNMHNKKFNKEVFEKRGLFYKMFDQADLVVEDKGEVLASWQVPAYISLIRFRSFPEVPIFLGSPYC
jgi:hypothetical protein